MTPDQQGIPYVITKPGGLSGTAHAVHILICLLTCGLWIPGYILFVALAPAQRQEVLSPYGQPVPPVPGLRWTAPPQTPEQIRVGNRRIALVLLAIGGVIAVAVGVAMVLTAINH